MRKDPSYSQYAYVTHEDLKHLNFVNRIKQIESMGGRPSHAMSDASQTILFAIQTPHGSILDVDSVTEEHHSVEDDSKAETRRRYHLIIDAEQADFEDGKDSEIQIFQVETKHRAPEQ